MLTTLICVAALTQSYRAQFPLPTAALGSGWGVNIHFSEPPAGSVEKIAEAGFKWIRVDLLWNEVESVRGRFDFGAYDHLMQALERNHMRALFILDYGNPNYQLGGPATDSARTAFGRYAEACFRHFGGRGVVWEVWNEPNLDAFWQPKKNVDGYIALVKEVDRARQRTAPDEWLIGPATSLIDMPFIKRCADAGLLSVFNAISVHPYRGGNPETVGLEYKQLRTLVGNLPIVSSEWGYSDLGQGMNPALHASLVVRQYLSNLMNGVNFSIFYDWQDDGADPRNPEHHFGIVGSGLREKPAFQSVKILSQNLAGYTFKGRVSLSAADDYLLRFGKGTQTKYVGWSERPSHNVDASIGRIALSPFPVILRG